MDRKTSKKTTKSTPLSGYGSFAAAVQARLVQSAATYGDRSFGADPAALVVELKQECLDLAGWGFILWTRLEAIKASLADLNKLGGEGHG